MSIKTNPFEYKCEREQQGDTHGEGAALLFVIRAVFGFAGFSSHSVLVPPAGDVLQQQQ